MTRDFDPTDLLAQEAAKAKDAEAERLARQFEVDDFKWLMGNIQGRRFMDRLLTVTGLFSGEWYPDGRLDFAAGQRNVGLRFWSDLHEICPEKYPLMVKEKQTHARRIDASRRS